MSASPLVLKDSNMVVLGLFVGPLAGLLALWLCIAVYGVVYGQPDLFVDLLLLPWILMFGMPLCFLAEAVVAAPLLVGFKRYQWRWLNEWSVCGIGFLAGALPCFVLFALAMRDPNPTHTTWLDVFRQSAGCGVVGLVGAFVFQAIAVERTP